MNRILVALAMLPAGAALAGDEWTPINNQPAAPPQKFERFSWNGGYFGLGGAGGGFNSVASLWTYRVSQATPYLGSSQKTENKAR